MKIIVFTYDRPDSITTSEYFKNHDHVVLCHEGDMKKQYEKGGRVYGKLIATQQPKGLANNRNYALSLIEEGEWVMFVSDDLENVYRYKHYNEADYGVIPEEIDPNKSFNETINSDSLLKVCKEEIEYCEKNNIYLSGFASNENGFFLKKKKRNWSLVDGRCILVKKTKLKFDKNTQLVDDYSFTALNLQNYGKVNINQWVIPKCKRYTKGAYGSIEKRMNQKLKECKYLVETYPDLIRYADKPNHAKGSHIKFRYNKNPMQKSLF
tara:strand:+ start:1348 stop:2145 length:798 start_codon:yes stop_codon:yes gene_type:complete